MIFNKHPPLVQEARLRARKIQIDLVEDGLKFLQAQLAYRQWDPGVDNQEVLDRAIEMTPNAFQLAIAAPDWGSRGLMKVSVQLRHLAEELQPEQDCLQLRLSWLDNEARVFCVEGGPEGVTAP